MAKMKVDKYSNRRKLYAMRGDKVRIIKRGMDGLVIVETMDGRANKFWININDLSFDNI